MHARTRGTAVVVVLVVAAVLAAVLVVRALRRGPEVVLLGDSITFQSAQVFDEVLGDRWGLTTHGVPAMRADQLAPAVPDLAARNPVQLVINLGTNDVVQGTPPAETEAALERLVDGFSSVRCVHLVTINEQMTSLEGVDLGARAVNLNVHIRDLAARRGWSIVAWDALVRLYEAGPKPDGPLTTDTVHPTEHGQRVLADAYGKALETCPL